MKFTGKILSVLPQNKTKWRYNQLSERRDSLENSLGKLSIENVKKKENKNTCNRLRTQPCRVI